MIKLRKLEEQLESIPLTAIATTEWYYIISDLLSLGGLGSGLVEREKLFISFDSYPPDDISEIRFFFISTMPQMSSDMNGPETTIALGRIAEGFDEIEYHHVTRLESDINSDTQEFKANQISRILSNATIPKMRPLSLTKGLIHILDQPGFRDRKINSLFLLDENSPLGAGIRHRLSFGTIQNVDYSGDYYLIVKPSCDVDEPCNEVFDFVITDNEDENYYPHYIQSKIETRVTKVTDEFVERFEA